MSKGIEYLQVQTYLRVRLFLQIMTLSSQDSEFVGMLTKKTEKTEVVGPEVCLVVVEDEEGRRKNVT